MEKKSLWRYVVELLIVIVGVTIAFWLNTRAEASKEEQTLNNYYKELQSDLMDDQKFLAKAVKFNETKGEVMVKALELYLQGTPSRDSVYKYTQEVGNYFFFEPKDVTYRSMISSGDLKLVENFPLKRKLISLYDYYDVIDQFQINHLRALDDNYFPKYVYMVDYMSDEVVVPIEEDLMIKNYFAFCANEMSQHVGYYQTALDRNKQLISAIEEELK